MNKISILEKLNKIAQALENLNMPNEADDVTGVMENIVDSPQITAWTNFGKSLAKKDPDFIPPIKPKVSMISYLEVTEKALFEYHLYKNNKKQTSKFTAGEESQYKNLATNADRAR